MSGAARAPSGGCIFGDLKLQTPGLFAATRAPSCGGIFGDLLGAAASSPGGGIYGTGKKAAEEKEDLKTA